MPGFPSSFPDPGEREIARYRKLRAMLADNSGAADGERQAARKAIDQLETEHPRIRFLATIPEDAVAPLPRAGFQPSAESHPRPAPAQGPGLGPATAGVFNFFSGVLGAVASAHGARMAAQDHARVSTRRKPSGAVAITVEIDPAILRQARGWDELTQGQFAQGAADLVLAELLAELVED